MARRLGEDGVGVRLGLLGPFFGCKKREKCSCFGKFIPIYCQVLACLLRG